MKPRFCPNCKEPLTEEQTELGDKLTTWEVCEECGYTRMTKAKEVKP